MLKKNICKTVLRFLVKNLIMVSLASSMMKKITLLCHPSRFSSTLIYCIALGTGSIAFCLLKSSAIIF